MSTDEAERVGSSGGCQGWVDSALPFYEGEATPSWRCWGDNITLLHGLMVVKLAGWARGGKGVSAEEVKSVGGSGP